jgi:hypothetical protein
MTTFQGRLFMVVVFSITLCLGWGYALVMASPDQKGIVFGSMLALVMLIINSYFTRQDRPKDPPNG